MTHYDPALVAESFAGPGTDTRQWTSFGTVDPDTPDARSVIFSDAYGPLVHVTLHPSGIPVVCRVAQQAAGNGEGEWHPFVAGDEVLVCIPEGDEQTCVIVGRMSQEIDRWPKQVAGQDATQNNFAFRRIRTPYVFETAGGYVVRNATTKAFFSISPAGAVTLGNADQAILTLSADFLGLQNGDADVLLQIDVSKKQLVLEAAGTKAVLDASRSSLYTSGTMEIGTAGNQAAGHATTIEAVVGLFQAFAVAAAAASTTPISLVGFFASLPATLATLIPAAAATPLGPLLAVVQQGLQVPAQAGGQPGLGAGGLLIG